MLGRLVEGSTPLWPVRFAAVVGGSESTSISRCSVASPDSETESATERGMDAARTEPLVLPVLPVLLVLLVLLAPPGKGIPVLAPLGPMAL